MAEATLFQTKDPTLDQKSQILRLWNTEYPSNISHKDIAQLDAYLDGLEECQHLMLVDYKEKILAWYIDFLRQGERWFVILVDSRHQGQGMGNQLLGLAKNRHKVLNGWMVEHDMYFKADGSRYSSPLGFYKKQDFKILKDCRLELPEISAVKIRWQH